MKKYLMMGAAALLMGGATLTSCSSDKELYDASMDAQRNADKILQDYAANFKKVFGEIAPEQTWGFGAPAGARATRANPGESYPATHEYKDANGNVIAGANMNHNEWADPDKYFGGWLVPDALTEGQKLRVQKYFQANPNLSYQDPHFRHFFVQQVYTGGTDAPTTGNKESTKAADGTVHAGSTLNQLTVGQACSHINDFNAGTCTASNVLDNGSNVNNGTYHSDQITLMVNVYDTSCFGYHETGGSNVKGVINHNDKMALVSAATIDAWAAANGNPGEAVVDKWNRSFMGFDYELLPEADIIPENPTYAKFTDVPAYNNLQYAWDGTKVMVIGTAPEATEAEEIDITSTFAQNTSGNDATCAYDDNGKIVCTFGLYSAVTFVQTGDWGSYSKLVIEFEEPSPFSGTLQCTKDARFSKGDTKVEVELSGELWTGYYGPVISTYTGEGGTLTIKKVTLVKEAYVPDASIVYYDPNGYLLGDDNKVMFYSSSNTNMYGGTIINLSEDEMKTTQDGKTCLNLVKFNQLAAEGYHPISTDLKKWVKWQAACDGYYSDWIVTLTEAQRLDVTPTNPFLRVIAEDLTADEEGDFDFNDIVFDVEYVNAGQAKVTILAAGGTLPLYINGKEVHQLFIDENKDAKTDQNGVINVKTMINTGAKRINPKDPYSSAELANKPVFTVDGTWSDDQETFAAQVRDNIILKVDKENEEGKLTPITLTAEQGRTPGKVGISDPGYNWKGEKLYIGDNFKKFVSQPKFAMWWKMEE